MPARVFFHTHEEVMDASAEWSIVCTTSDQQQLLQHGHVPDGAWTDVLDQDGTPTEAMEKPERNDLDDEGAEGQTPAKRMRYRQKSNPTDTTAHVEHNESAFSIQDEADHKVWQEFHRRQKLQ